MFVVVRARRWECAYLAHRGALGSYEHDCESTTPETTRGPHPQLTRKRFQRLIPWSPLPFFFFLQRASHEYALLSLPVVCRFKTRCSSHCQRFGYLCGLRKCDLSSFSFLRRIGVSLPTLEASEHSSNRCAAPHHTDRSHWSGCTT